MTTVVAAIRPDSWNFPLFLHVLGAMVLVGAVTAAVAAQFTPAGPWDVGSLRRFSFRTLLFVAVPAWFVTTAGSEWIRSKEFGDAGDNPTWIGIGYAALDGGGLLLLIATICAGLASRKSRPRLATASGVLGAIALAAWIVAIWAMGAKPD